MNDLLLFAKALSDPIRVRILLPIFQQELCVCEIADALELPQSTLSTHLQVLREAGLVKTRRVGKWVYYSLQEEKRPYLSAFLEPHREDLVADTRLQRDALRIKQRLAIRENGCCVRPSRLGFLCEEEFLPILKQKGGD